MKTRATDHSRILMLSHRNLYDCEVWRASFREFEGIIQQIESVDVLAPEPGTWYQQQRSHAIRMGKVCSLLLNPGIPEIKVDKNYDLFFAVFEKPSELLSMNAVRDWKDRCKASICWVTEFYVKEMALYKSALRVLSEFDHVLFMFDNSDPFKAVIKGKGMYMPSGIDAAQFCPYPNPPERCIDVLSIGRRAPKTHQALLRMARGKGLHYVFDTINDLHAYNIEEHRFLFSNLVKRSKYFIVNPGKIDSPQETGGQSEFGYRYFEGAAPGTIMIGEYPKNKEFDRIFTWPDAVIHLPYNSEDIEPIINALDEDPKRQDTIRRKNVTSSLLHHDWVYRWQEILRIAGLEPLPQLVERKQRLARMAKLVEESTQAH